LKPEKKNAVSKLTVVGFLKSTSKAKIVSGWEENTQKEEPNRKKSRGKATAEKDPNDPGRWVQEEYGAAPKLKNPAEQGCLGGASTEKKKKAESRRND